MTAAIIEARDLVKRFDGFTAVDHISFGVEAGASGASVRPRKFAADAKYVGMPGEGPVSAQHAAAGNRATEEHW